MKVLRLVVPSDITYTLNILSQVAGVSFDDRRVVDVPLNTNQQLSAARTLERQFIEDGMSGFLRNGPNAVAIYSAVVIDL